MASSAMTGHGTLLQRASAVYPDATGYTTIAEITTDLSHAMSADVIDTTHHGSAGYEDKNQGIKRIDEMQVEANWLADATQDFSTGVGKQFLDGSKFNFKLILPSTGGTYIFHGFIKDFKVLGQLKGVQKVMFTICPSGAHTTTPTD